MQSATNTAFKQKTCPKCKNNHDNEGVLCSFCIAAAEQARAKIQKAPESFWVKCLIVREGDTTLNVGSMRYTFKHNEHGDSVCEMINQGHYAAMTKTEFYEPYVWPEKIEEEDEEPANKAPLLPEAIGTRALALEAEGLTPSLIAKKLAEENDTEEPDFTWQRIAKFLAAAREPKQ